MPVTAEVQNPRLGFQFAIYVDGIFAALVQSVQKPNNTIEVVEHSPGGQPHINKTAGGTTIGDLVIEKAMFADDSDTWAWDWMKNVVDPVTQRLGVPSSYYKTIEIHDLNGAGETLEVYEYEGCWPKDRAFAKNDGQDKTSKMMETVTFSVNRQVRP